MALTFSCRRQHIHMQNVIDSIQLLLDQLLYIKT